MNKKELYKIMDLLANEDEEIRFIIRKIPNQIAAQVLLIIDGRNEIHDVSDYDSW